MTFQDILDAIAEVEETPIGRGIELRMGFSKLVNQRLKKEGWTQKKLADKCGKFESYISNVINGNKNLTFDSAGEILFALKVRADFTVVEEESPVDSMKEVTGSNGNQTTGRLTFREINYGKEPQSIKWTYDETSKVRSAKNPRIELFESSYIPGY
jgi:transcriptional regulator with XRE-family HTH domain